MRPFYKDYDVTKKMEEMDKVSKKLDVNLERLKKELSYPTNEDILIRSLVIGEDKKCCLIYLNGMVDKDVIQREIIAPLYDLKKEKNKNIISEVITAKEVNELDVYSKVIDSILVGRTIVIIDGYDKVLSVDTVKFDHRGVEKPITENIIKGPQEAFVESGNTNLSLIRKSLRSQYLVNEKVTVGKKSKSTVSILYLKDIVNEELLDQVKERLNKLNVDTVQNISILEQYIEERPYSLLPSVLFTERPDRAVAFLHEGHIVLLMDTSSDCLILPATFWSIFHTSEDTYLRWSSGNFIRIVRVICFIIATMTPGLFIAITNFHIDMIPADLALAIAATRERVPFPLIIEVATMELAFEILRESGIRIPTPIGPTIGIVGALILGQAAVQANLVSPILVIVVSITGLSSFAIANISLNFFVRITKFILLIAGGFMGIAGIATVSLLFLVYAASMKSFGVPFLSPLAPYYKSSNDIIYRKPLWKQWVRPQFTKPQEYIRKSIERKE